MENWQILKHRIAYILWVLLYFYFFPQDSFSQGNIRFNRINREDGLSQNSVNTIMQDRNGFIWIGTSEGLNRYDGYTFKIYKPDLFDSTSISDSWITSLFQDSKGYIWVGTFGGGLNQFDIRTGKFKRIKNNQNNANSLCNDFVNCIAEDKESNLWIGSENGISVLDPERTRYTNYVHSASVQGSLIKNTIKSIYVDSKDRVWIGTNGGGLELFNRQKNDFQHFTNDPSNFSSISSNTIWQITQDPNDNSHLWIATSLGLNCLNSSSFNFTRIPNKGNGIFSDENIVQTLLADGKGRIWFGTKSNGLNYLELKTKKIYHFENNQMDLHSLSSDQILCIIQDKSGLIWVGTRNGGVDRVIESNFNNLSFSNGNTNRLTTDEIWTIFEQHNDLWIGTSNGLIKHDISNGTDQYYRASQGNGSINCDYVYSIFIDNEEGLWVGTSEGGLSYRPKNSSTFKYYTHNPTDSNSLCYNYVRCITQDKSGLIWIGTRGGGICSFDKSSGKFNRYSNNPNSSNSLSHDRVNTILVDYENNLWIGTSGGGLNKFDTQKKRFTSFTNIHSDSSSLNDVYVLSLYQSKDSTIWIGTYNGGLNALNIKTGKISHFTQKDGLPNNIVYGIIEDSKNNLWLSTNYGLCRFNPKTRQIKNYDIASGIQGLEFNTGAYFKGNSGTFYFGGTQGLTSFKPEEIIDQSYTPPVFITEFKIFDQPVKYGKNSVLKQPIICTDTIKLNYKQSIFSFVFSSLHYSSPNKNQYSFILDRFENHWNNSGNINFARYSNIPPGDYVFKVKGTNSDGIWNQTPTQIHLIITPPFWKTNWFRFSFVALILASIYLIIVIREQNLRRSKRKLIEKVRESTYEIQQQNTEIAAQRDYALEQKKYIEQQNIELEKHRNGLEQLVKERTSELEVAKEKAEESDRLKSAFLANMSHEIRTPMNAIVGFSSLLVEKDIPEEKKKEYSKYITQNGNTLIQLIDDVLNISMMEAGQLKLNKQNYNINKMFSELAEIFSVKIRSFEEKEITLIPEVAQIESAFYLNTDPIRLLQILTNLLDNAIKFTEKGTIKFGYELLGQQGNQHLRFFVKDSGIGLSEKQRSQLFQRFSRVAESKEKIYRGTGLGLSICKNLVELFGGKIWVESELNVGSTFYFTHPYQSVIIEETNEITEKPLTTDFLTNKSILIAEDEETSFLLLKAILAKSNVIVLHAINGSEAVEIVKTTKVDLILMDINMPIMNGFEATKIIKELDKSIPVIAQTAYAFESDKIKSYESGCDAYISKPIDRYVLMELLRKFLK